MAKILLLPGDGVGTEIMVQARRVLDWANGQEITLNFEMTQQLVGGVSYDAEGTPLTDAVLAEAMVADAVLLGAVGGPDYDHVPRNLRPEVALLQLRKELDLFANLRPACTFPALASASSLKADIVSGLDILIVRELTSGVYFGTPRGMETLPDGTERCVDTQSYNRDEIIRIAEVAFELARERNGLVHSAEKSNVMETGMFWRNIVSDLHREKYSDVKLQHILADNCAMQLVRAPKQFDVLVTDNLFGDLLSDVAAMLTGSLGMLPSASLGSADASGRRKAMYEPVHGTAPDIAGKNIVNPIAMIASVAMMLRYSFASANLAEKIENAIADVLASGVRTADIALESENAVSTEAMGDAILAQLG